MKTSSVSQATTTPRWPSLRRLPLLSLLGLLALSAPAQITYQAQVLSDAPLAYYRLSEPGPLVPDVALNSGSLGAAGNGVSFPGLVHQVPGAIVGDSDTAAGYTAIDQSSCDGGYPTVVPYNAALNPSGSFTVELWLQPMLNGLGNAQMPIHSRFDDASGNRNGWDFWQRDAGTGWNWRLFNGNGSGKAFDITGGPYTVGQWCHLVAVYDASVASATLYLNGVQVAQSTTPNGTYAPNPSAPLSVGGYEDGSQNPFIGPIDEVAIYTKALSAAQVLAHYQNGTNPSRSTPYSSLIVADGAVEYLRLDEPAHNTAANLGSLTDAPGTYVNTTQAVAGPQAPAYAGIEAANSAAAFNGNNSYVELCNPPELNFWAGDAFSLEAWIQPAASQNSEAYIIAHGGNSDWSGEDTLRIENGSYNIGAWPGAGGASYPIPAGDLGGGAWVHLVGTYDGYYWNLYRNGVLVAQSFGIGPMAVDNANWAIGARGRWQYGWGFPATGEERQFSGRIDEAAIYGYALAPERVQAHYYAGRYANLNPKPAIVQQPASLSAFAGTPATLTIEADGAPPLSYQWYRNGSPVGSDSSALSFAQVQFSDAGSYTVSVTSPAGSTNSAVAVLTVPATFGSIVCQDQPVAYYPLNETSGSVAHDRFSGAYNGAYQWAGSSVTLGVPSPAPALGTAANFNNGGRVWIGNPSVLNQSGRMTLEAWVNPHSTGGDQYIISHGIDWNNWREIVLRIEGNQYQVGSWYWDGASWQDHAAMTIPASDLNTWVHLVGTYDGAQWNLYHNGVLVNSNTAGGPISLSQDWSIGGAGSAERWFNGGICHAAIYTTALTAQQIATHYAASAPHALSITSAGGTVTLTWPAGTLQQADTVNGTYTDVPGNPPSGYSPTPGPTKKFYRLRF